MDEPVVGPVATERPSWLTLQRWREEFLALTAARHEAAIARHELAMERMRARDEYIRLVNSGVIVPKGKKIPHGG
jgi:hypothetical protein